MKGTMRWTGLLSLAVLAMVLLAPRPAWADYTGLAAPRIADQSGTPPFEFSRALSLCVESDHTLPVQVTLALEPWEFQGRLVMEVTPLGEAPDGLGLWVGDIGSAVLEERTTSRVVLRGFSFDLNLALRTWAVFADGVGEALYTTTFCYPDGICTQARMHVVFEEGTDAVDVTTCDAPPVLEPADDNGARTDDDYTSAQPLRFTVNSAEASVSLLRDGAVIATSPVVGGAATLADASAPDFAVHAYQVRHGARVPSAARFIERHEPPGAPTALNVLFGDQSARVQQTFTGPLRARVADANGLGVPGVDATLTVVPGATGALATFPGGTSSFTGHTDALGEFDAPLLTAGTVTGTFAVRLSLAGVPDGQTTMRVLPGPVASLVVLSGSLQQAALGETFEAPLRVRVRDAFGNPAQNASVTFSAPAVEPTAWFLPGSSSGATRQADASGEVSIEARAVFAAGSYQVITASNGHQGTFALENLVQGPASIEATTSVDLVNLAPGSHVQALPTVRVRDHLQQPLAGIRVTFTQVEGDAIVSGVTSLTDANGLASLGGWQLGAQDTVSRLEAKAFGLPPVAFGARTWAEVDAGVSVDNGLATLTPGQTATWTVQVTNTGPGPARDTALLLDGTGIALRQWRCIAVAPSVCSASSGVTWPSLDLDVAAADAVVVEVDADVTALPGSEAGLGAGIELGSNIVDLNPANDDATDVDTVVSRAARIFTDGFEGDG